PPSLACTPRARRLARCFPITGGTGSAYWARVGGPFSRQLGSELQPPAFRGVLPVHGTPSLAVPGGLLLSRIAFAFGVSMDVQQDCQTLMRQRLELAVKQVGRDRTRGLKQPPEEVGGEHGLHSHLPIGVGPSVGPIIP